MALERILWDLTWFKWDPVGSGWRIFGIFSVFRGFLGVFRGLNFERDSVGSSGVRAGFYGIFSVFRDLFNFGRDSVGSSGVQTGFYGIF